MPVELVIVIVGDLQKPIFTRNVCAEVVIDVVLGILTVQPSRFLP